MDDLPQVSETGNRLETLKALRQKVAEAIDKSKSGRDIAALSRQLQIIMIEIEDIKENDTSNDEIRRILAEREANGKPGAVRQNRSALYTAELKKHKLGV